MVLACVAAALPVVQTMRYATVQADLVETLFTENRTATAPRGISEADPWAGRERVSILLLGGDGSVTREGVRTDSVMLLVIDTSTGRSVVFSLPRNMMYAQFPADSPLHDAFPDGFTDHGDAPDGMLNAVYGQVPARYPGILGDSDNEGADALKQAVAGSLGIDVDYYVLVNLLGFQQVVDAMGGVTVNVNEPVAINGDTDLGIPPTGYIEPGPDQHLDGFHALWFSRGRWGSDDYERMLRQRCMVGALIDAADPVTLVRRYLDLAQAGKEIVRTDIPRSVLPALVNLGLRVKEHRVRSVAFVSSDRFFSGDPDYAWMQESVSRAMATPDGSRPPAGSDPVRTLARPPRRPPRPATSSPTAAAEPDPGDSVDVGQLRYQPVTWRVRARRSVSAGRRPVASSSRDPAVPSVSAMSRRAQHLGGRRAGCVERLTERQREVGGVHGQLEGTGGQVVPQPHAARDRRDERGAVVRVEEALTRAAISRTAAAGSSPSAAAASRPRWATSGPAAMARVAR